MRSPEVLIKLKEFRKKIEAPICLRKVWDIKGV